MKKEQVLAKLRSCGLVAVVRAKDADDAMRIAEACIEGGCAGIELTYTTPGVNAIIEKMAREYDGTDFVIGAGTVMDPETARMAILSGAQYVVSPYFNGDTVRLCNRYRVACMPGAMSIAEVVAGMEAGADIIKVFPGELFGPKILKSIHGPIPQAELMPTGGVSLDNVAEWIAAGAVAVGAGGSLTAGAKTGDYGKITETARQFGEKIRAMNPIGMHYGFWSHNWDEIAYIPLMEKLAWLGFDICEVASAEWGYYDDARLRELKACADHNGLGITYSIGLEAKYDLASDDPAVRENGIRHVTRILESMPKVGAAILNGVSYAGWQALPDHGITLDEKRRKEELALESMSRLMKVAEDCGVLYCCEVVNRFEQYLLNTAKEGVEFVKRLGSPNARVLLDTFHMNIEEDSMVDAILEAGPWLGHFHVGENNRRPAGSTNRLPWKDMAAALKQVNYQGAIVMEPFVLMGGTIPYDIKVWRDLSSGAGEAGLDEMAGRACRFLKELTA